MDKFHKGKIKNIIFDLDGTLVHKKRIRPFFIQTYLESFGVAFTERQILEAGLWSHRFWYEKTNWDLTTPDDAATNSFEIWHNYLQYYYKILEVQACSLDYIFEDLVKLIDDDGPEEYLMENTCSLLSILNDQGYRLGVLSNRFSSIDGVINRYALGAYLKCNYSGGELESYKPDKVIFEKYLALFGGKPEESIYVGDNYWLDTLGAQNAGLTPVLLDVFDWYRNFDVLRITQISNLMDLLS